MDDLGAGVGRTAPMVYCKYYYFHFHYLGMSQNPGTLVNRKIVRKGMFIPSNTVTICNNRL